MGWLPVGSVVRLRGGDGLAVVCGHMQEEAGTGTWWDYLGYPYPEGRADPTRDYLFDREDVEEVRFVGYRDVVGEGYLDLLAERDADFRRGKAERAGGESSLRRDTDGR